MKKYFPYIIFGSALLISIVAEFFSIFGISKLFSGAHTATIILAIALGVGKLVGVSAVQQYWNVLGKTSSGKTLRIYLAAATVVLVVITSAGVYGFLAAAYQETANQDRLIQTRIELLKTKQSRFKEQYTQLSGESKSLAISLENLRKSLSTDNQYQTIDRRTGQVLTQVQSTSKKGVQDQVDKTSGKKDEIDLKLDRLNDSISFYDLAIIETEANAKSSSELGPLKYLSGLTGYPMDKIINWLMLLLVFVIDPLAIALVLTAQFAFRQNRWIQGAETRRRNRKKSETQVGLKTRLKGWFLENMDRFASKFRKPVKSPTIDDLDQSSINIPEDGDRSTEAKSEPSTGIVQSIPVPKKRGRPKGSKSKGQNKKNIDDGEEHFNVEIDPIADPDGVFSNERKIIETGLNPDTAEHIIQSLGQNKKKV